MLLEEANVRLKRGQIDGDQLDGLNSLYILLDLDKDIFCKIVDVVGVDALLKKRAHYDRLDRAEIELSMKERYLDAKARIAEVENEKRRLQQIIDGYKPY